MATGKAEGKKCGVAPGSSSLCGRGRSVQAAKWFGRQISFFNDFRPWDLGKGFTRACSELYLSPSSPSYLGEIGDENEEKTGPGLREI